VFEIEPSSGNMTQVAEYADWGELGIWVDGAAVDYANKIM
jgi:hypothetical protein